MLRVATTKLMSPSNHVTSFLGREQQLSYGATHIIHTSIYKIFAHELRSLFCVPRMINYDRALGLGQLFYDTTNIIYDFFRNWKYKNYKNGVDV
jgi:hypothetical protein